VSAESLDLAQTEYAQGKVAFERGDYQQSIEFLQRSIAALDPRSRLGGEVQVWLVMAYEAAGLRSDAIALCQKISTHPDYDTRIQSKRLRYILEAPKLRSREEWLTKIPDLSEVADNDEKSWGTSKFTLTVTAPRAPEKPKFDLIEPVDPSQVKTQDPLLFWLAAIATGLVLGGLVWFS
jgi:tetratricopeptide (TPR) repeat protein